MERNERNWLTIREFELCYPLEYLEYLETFEQENKTCVVLDETAIKKIDLLIKKDNELQDQKFNERVGLTQQKESSNNNKIKFYGNQTEFVELIKSLIENGNLKGTQKDIIENCSNFFDIEIKNADITIQKIKGRNNGSETKFLDTLKTTLFDYIKTEKIK